MIKRKNGYTLRDIYFNIDKNTLSIYEPIEGKYNGFEDYYFVKKMELNLSDYLFNLYNECATIKEKYEKNNKKVIEVTTPDDFGPEIMEPNYDENSCIKEYITSTNLFIDENLNLVELDKIISSLLHFSNNNPFVFLSLNIDDELKEYPFFNGIRSYYRLLIGNVNGTKTPIIHTQLFIKFVIYLCNMYSKEYVKRFNVCPGCGHAFVAKRTNQIYCNDAHKSMYNRNIKKTPVLATLVGIRNEIISFKKKSIKKEETKNNIDLVMEKWITVAKKNIDDYKQAFCCEASQISNLIVGEENDEDKQRFFKESDDDYETIKDFREFLANQWIEISKQYFDVPDREEDTSKDSITYYIVDEIIRKKPDCR